MKHSKLLHPTHCFCHFSEDELRPWVVRKFRDHISTTDLLRSTTDPHEREIVSIVSLLDVDEATLSQMMGDINMTGHQVLHCREKVKKMLGIHGDLLADEQNEKPDN